MEERSLCPLPLEDEFRISKQHDCFDVGEHLTVDKPYPGLSHLTLHIERNLTKVMGDNIFGYTRQLRKGVEDDFAELALILKTDSKLSHIRIIRGVTVFSEGLGLRYGFRSWETKDSKFLAWMARRKKLKTKKVRGNTNTIRPVREFIILREEFLRRYLPKENKR